MNNCKWGIVMVVVVALLGSIGFVLAQDTKGQPVVPSGKQESPEKKTAEQEQPVALPKCPVTGEPVNLAVSVATDEGPVFFCCSSCIKKYQADPAKFANQVKEQRRILASRPKVQLVCPVSGEPVDSKVSIEYQGNKVFFCCKDCPAKFQKEPAKYQAALANSYTYQTKCPVSGKPIDPKAFTMMKGGYKVYFCCPNCPEKFTKDPAQYSPKLKEQGYDISD